ncbi:MAG: DUF3299 domain-containing protein [Planctomycetota bacterium]
MPAVTPSQSTVTPVPTAVLLAVCVLAVCVLAGCSGGGPAAPNQMAENPPASNPLAANPSASNPSEAAGTQAVAEAEVAGGAAPAQAAATPGKGATPAGTPQARPSEPAPPPTLAPEGKPAAGEPSPSQQAPTQQPGGADQASQSVAQVASAVRQDRSSTSTPATPTEEPNNAVRRTTGQPSTEPPPAKRKPPTTAELDRLVPKTFEDIKFDIEPDAPYRREMLTDAVERLNGQRVRIRGFILPTPQKRGLREFVLVRDNLECCFGPGAALYDCILVRMREGTTADFSNYPVAVEGRFGIEAFPPGSGEHPLAIYRLEGELVER